MPAGSEDEQVLPLEFPRKVRQHPLPPTQPPPITTPAPPPPSKTRTLVLPLSLPARPTQPLPLASHSLDPGAGNEGGNSKKLIQNASKAQVRIPQGPIYCSPTHPPQQLQSTKRPLGLAEGVDNSGSNEPTQDANEDGAPPTKRQKTHASNVTDLQDARPTASTSNEETEDTPGGSGVDGKTKQGKAVKGRSKAVNQQSKAVKVTPGERKKGKAKAKAEEERAQGSEEQVPAPKGRQTRSKTAKSEVKTEGSFPHPIVTGFAYP